MTFLRLVVFLTVCVVLSSEHSAFQRLKERRKMSHEDKNMGKHLVRPSKSHFNRLKIKQGQHETQKNMNVEENTSHRLHLKGVREMSHEHKNMGNHLVRPSKSHFKRLNFQRAQPHEIQKQMHFKESISHKLQGKKESKEEDFDARPDSLLDQTPSNAEADDNGYDNSTSGDNQQATDNYGDTSGSWDG